MELFDIDESPKSTIRSLHPAFVQSTHQRSSYKKGSCMSISPSTLIRCEYFAKAKGLKALFSRKGHWIERFIVFDNEIMYLLENKKGQYRTKCIWSLTRLLSLRIRRERNSEIKLVFVNKSRNPLDEMKEKLVDVPEIAWFLQKLKDQLSRINVDLEIKAK